MGAFSQGQDSSATLGTTVFSAGKAQLPAPSWRRLRTDARGPEAEPRSPGDLRGPGSRSTAPCRATVGLHGPPLGFLLQAKGSLSVVLKGPRAERSTQIRLDVVELGPRSGLF